MLFISSAAITHLQAERWLDKNSKLWDRNNKENIYENVKSNISMKIQKKEIRLSV